MKKKDIRTYEDRKIYKRQKERLDCELLTDRHVIKVIKRNTNFNSKQIRENPDLIELYRFRLNLKRILKNDRKT